MKKKIITLLMAGLVLCSSMNVMAAPEQMADGNYFDAEYYAATYPDVVAVFGTDKALLYQHFTLAGVNEGRLPYNPADQAYVDALVAMQPMKAVYTGVPATIRPGQPWYPLYNNYAGDEAFEQVADAYFMNILLQAIEPNTVKVKKNTITYNLTPETAAVIGSIIRLNAIVHDEEVKYKVLQIEKNSNTQYTVYVNSVGVDRLGQQFNLNSGVIINFNNNMTINRVYKLEI